MTLDLHGVKHEDVQRELDKIIWEAMQKKKPRLLIITGHSEEMKRIVSSVASEYGLTTVQHMFNNGELIIDLV